MEQVFMAMTDSIYQILDAVSKFDIREVNPQMLAMLWQVIADAGRTLYDFIVLMIIVFGD